MLLMESKPTLRRCLPSHVALQLALLQLEVSLDSTARFCQYLISYFSLSGTFLASAKEKKKKNIQYSTQLAHFEMVAQALPLAYHY